MPREGGRLHPPHRGKRPTCADRSLGVGDLLRQAEVSYLLITLRGAVALGMEGETLVIVEPIAADLDLDEVEVALLNAAVDYAAGAGVLLLANDGYWLARLRAAG